MDNMTALLLGGYTIFILLSAPILWGFFMRWKDNKRKYWYIARRQIDDPDNVTLSGPFESAVVSLAFIIKHPNIGITIQAFQYELPAHDVTEALKLIEKGAVYVREIQPLHQQQLEELVNLN